MEDSGIDSDSKSISYGCVGATSGWSGHDTSMAARKENTPHESNLQEAENQKDEINETIPTSSSQLMTTVQLQKRLEKQIQQARKIRKEAGNDSEVHPKKSLISRNRLTVPSKSQVPVVTKSDEHPLVTWESESDDDYEFHSLSKSATREITQQLIRDGYNLDLTPDDEDLDLIPPKPLNQRCACFPVIQKPVTEKMIATFETTGPTIGPSIRYICWTDMAK
ncbi:protein FAM219A isoform X2 [Centruroides vittatus]|uniref:protein FAM219A isoform X2 n=1 Tax=Centruroides vittatus TaxID=120091 RepID=UPI00350ECD2A